MCRIIDTAEDELELDKTLLSAFRQWKSLTCFLLDEEDMKGVSWIEDFCSDMRERLRTLKVQK